MHLDRNILLIFISFLLNIDYIHAQESKNAKSVDNCDDLKSFVVDEVRKIRANERNLEQRISDLEKENHLKQKRIETLEKLIHDRLEVVEENAGESVVRRQARNHIAFTAYLGHVQNITKQQPIVYDHILLNDGGAYDSTTGMFTAPVSGVYLFSYSVGAKHLAGSTMTQFDVFTRLVVNGVHQVSAVAESTNTDDDEQGSSTAILFVLEGDKVWTVNEFRGGNYVYASDFQRVTSFTGTLLYERDIGSGIIG